MNILIYTSIVPFPLDEGGRVAQYGFIESLIKNAHHVTLVSAGGADQAHSLSELKKKLPGIEIKNIKDHEPSQKRSFKQQLIRWTAWQLKKRIKENNVNHPVLDNEWFLRPVRPKSWCFIKSWFEILEETKPDIIQIDFTDNADLALLVGTSVRKVIIAHDIRHASVKQAAQLIEHKTSLYSSYLAGYVKTMETAYLNLFDAVLTFSSNDKQRLSNKISPDKIHVSPFPVLDNKFRSISREHTIDRLVFIGPDHHYPNLDAMRWYAESIGTLVYERLGLSVVVAGKWTDAGKALFKEKKFIEFAGFVENMDDVMKNAALIVPLRIGSGIRTKIIEAFALGIPVIATTLGCEGLEVNDGEALLIADDAEAFMQAIEKMTHDDNLAYELRTRAQEIAHQKFSQPAVYKHRIEIYNKLLH